MKIFSLVLKGNRVWHYFDYRHFWKAELTMLSWSFSINVILRNLSCWQGTTSLFPNVAKPSAVSTNCLIVKQGGKTLGKLIHFYGFSFLLRFDDCPVSILVHLQLLNSSSAYSTVIRHLSRCFQTTSPLTSPNWTHLSQNLLLLCFILSRWHPFP